MPAVNRYICFSENQLHFFSSLYGRDITFPEDKGEGHREERATGKKGERDEQREQNKRERE